MREATPEIQSQERVEEKELKEILAKNEIIQEILRKAIILDLPNWYLGAGCISQTVWNFKSGKELNNGINDYDLVYFDPDLSEEKEAENIQKAKELLGDIPIEVVNQARVHLWFKEYSGHEMLPYSSVEEGIRGWPTTATCVAIKARKDGSMHICAPFGLNDVLNMIARPNKVNLTEETYVKKVERWQRIWPKLKVIPW